MSGRFAGADQRMVGTANGRIAEFLADAESDPVEREQWQTVPAGEAELRPLDWSDVRRFLAVRVETPVADRHRLAEAEKLLRLGSGRRRVTAVLPRLHRLVAAGAVLGLETLHPGVGIVGFVGAAASLGWEGATSAVARRAATAGRSSKGARRELLRSGKIVASGAAVERASILEPRSRQWAVSCAHPGRRRPGPQTATRGAVSQTRSLLGDLPGHPFAKATYASHVGTATAPITDPSEPRPHGESGMVVWFTDFSAEAEDEPDHMEPQDLQVRVDEAENGGS